MLNDLRVNLRCDDCYYLVLTVKIVNGEDEMATQISFFIGRKETMSKEPVNK